MPVIMTLVPAEQIVHMISTAAVHTAAAGSFVPSENPVTFGLIIGAVFGFVLGWSIGGSGWACPFCSRSGKITGSYRNDADVTETRPARYCPMCGRKLRR